MRPNGSEKDLDEVLQTMSVFHNVGKGIVAKTAELQVPAPARARMTMGMGTTNGNDDGNVCSRAYGTRKNSVLDGILKSDLCPSDVLFAPGSVSHLCSNTRSNRPGRCDCISLLLGICACVYECMCV